MFNLSPRWKKQKLEYLGPNQYYLETQEVLKSRAPFLSTTERKTFGHVSSTDAIYNVQLPVRIKGGLNMERQSKRVLSMREYSDAGPGPGSYDIEGKKVLGCEKKGRKLYVCSVPYTLEARGPSVPSKADANGYDFNEDMELIKIPPDDFDGTVGPAKYETAKVSCLTRELYGGCGWSKLKSDRFPKAKEAPSPGPATYDLNAGRPCNERDEYVREMARRCCPQTRFLDAVLHRTLKENFPAPNQYNISSEKPQMCSAVPYPRSKRFTSLISSSPACNTYNLSKDLGKGPVSYIKSPFGSCTSRFSCKALTSTPGPADYGAQDTMEYRQVKNLRALTHKTPPFNRSSFREVGMPNNDDAPAPNTYLVESLDVSKEPCSGCHFRSITRRFQSVHEAKSAEPASFDVSEAFNKNHDRKSHNVREVPFDSKLPRRETQKFLTPAPNQYLGHGDVGGKGYYFYTVARRETLNENPGPGRYTVHPAFSLSMYRSMATHNLRLRENVLREKLKVSPARTRQAWIDEVKKSKKLIAFYTPPPKPLASWIVSD